MSLVFYKLFAAILIFLISFAIVIYPLRKKNNLALPETAQLGEALASGIFFGTAFFHMLPDAIHIFSRVYGNNTYPFPEAICVLGFLILLFLERLSLNRYIASAKHFVPLILLIMLSVHALIEGAALGIGAAFPETTMLFIAILAHKTTETFALCITLIRHQLSLRTIVIIILFFSCMTPLGIFLGAVIESFSYATSGALIAAMFNAFAAGTFLYISTLHHIHFHEHAKDTQGMLEFLFLALGVVAMAAIAVWT